jgi:hypothetical protein
VHSIIPSEYLKTSNVAFCFTSPSIVGGMIHRALGAGLNDCFNKRGGTARLRE